MIITESWPLSSSGPTRVAHADATGPTAEFFFCAILFTNNIRPEINAIVFFNAIFLFFCHI